MWGKGSVQMEADFTDYFENKLWQKRFKEARVQEGEPIQVAQLRMDGTYIVKRDFAIPGQLELRGGAVIKAGSYCERWLKDAIKRGLQLIEAQSVKPPEPAKVSEDTIICPHCGREMTAKTTFGHMRRQCVYCRGALR
jgi:hypothetical protein